MFEKLSNSWNLVKASAEVFTHVAIPMAACDPSGKVRVANTAFLEFIGVAGALYGVRAKNEQVERWADTSSQATKAGFELGAMFSPRKSFPR